MEQKAPTFPFYYRDWLHAVRRMNNDEKIEYLELLFEQADSVTGSIAPEIFNEDCTSDKVRAKFEEDSNGFFNVRMRDVLHKRDKYKRSRLKNLSTKKPSPHMGDHMEDHKGSHMEKEIEKEKEIEIEIVKGKGKNKEADPPLIYPWTDEIFLNRWAAWKQYKKEQHRFTYKYIGEQASLKKLAELSGGDMRMALAIIEQSMAQGWKGLFHLDHKAIKNQEALAAKPVYDELRNLADESIKASKK